MVSSLRSLARTGRLRAAINKGNRALVQGEGQTLRGISPALARRLASEIGVPLEPVVYDGAGKVFADAGMDVWDIGFLAIDATRAERVTFTRPYIVIEATYVVRADSGFGALTDADWPGRTVLVSAGSAYDMYLTGTLENASLVRSDTPAASFEEFREGRADFVAGVRETLIEAFGGDPDYRVLDGAFRRVEQAMVLPNFDDDRLPLLDDFVRSAIEEGFVARTVAGES